MQSTISSTPVMGQKTTSKNPVVSVILLVCSAVSVAFTAIYSLVYKNWTEQLSKAANTLTPIAQAVKTRKVSSVELARAFNDISAYFGLAASSVLSDSDALVIDQNTVIGGEPTAIRSEMSHLLRSFADQLAQLPTNPFWSRENRLAAVTHLRVAATIITSDKSDEAARKAFASALTGASIAFANQARFLQQAETFYVNGQIPASIIAQYDAMAEEQGPAEDYTKAGHNDPRFQA